MLQRADADELPAYHEATSPRNRVLYERHGYVSLGELVLPVGGPTVWRMWRDPVWCVGAAERVRAATRSFEVGHEMSLSSAMAAGPPPFDPTSCRGT